MNNRPITFIVRLWSRPDEFRAEVKPLQGGAAIYFHSAIDLINYLEQQPHFIMDSEGLDASWS